MEKLFVRIIEARTLKGADLLSGTSDPYIEVRIKGQTQHYKTKVVKNTCSPCWNEEFVLYPKAPNTDILLLKIYDYNMISTNELIGEVELPVSMYLGKGRVNEWKQVMKRTSHHFKQGHGQVHLSIEYAAHKTTQTVLTQSFHNVSYSHIPYTPTQSYPATYSAPSSTSYPAQSPYPTATTTYSPAPTTAYSGYPGNAPYDTSYQAPPSTYPGNAYPAPYAPQSSAYPAPYPPHQYDQGYPPSAYSAPSPYPAPYPPATNPSAYPAQYPPQYAYPPAY